ncbi:MAG: DUF2194 domain-containing protein [Ruminococcaceae bacterium]|nr:DUF2194 domain-containing protein [Oscillospiraceae bacterium]
MEKLKERFLKFRYNGILAIVLIFIVIALIVFIERSGISVNYTKRVLDYLPKEKIVTKEKAQINSQKNTVLLYNSLSASSSNALEEFKVIFTDMKVGYELIDLSSEPFPDLNNYKIAVVLTEDLTVFEDNVFTLCDWVYDGGSTLFAVSLSKSVYTTVIETRLGILDSSYENTEVESIFVEKDFMAGGGRTFYIDDGFDSAWSVQLDEKKAKVYAYTSGDKKTPLIWETKYGKGKFVVDNFGLYEKVMRGFFVASYSLCDDVCVYPVINGNVFYLDDFPSQIPSGDNRYIKRDFGTSIRDFYVNIWWPDMMNFQDKYNLKYTGLAILCYDDVVDGTTPSNADKGTFLNFGNMLLRQGGEIGYHGYNHQPLCLSDCDYRGEYDYKTWDSTGAMKGAFDELIDFCDELFGTTPMNIYVPPSNILSYQGQNFLLSEYPHIKTISGIYFPDSDCDYTCVQEFEVLNDGRVLQPRIVSGCEMDNFMSLAVISELNFHYANSHFTHPDDALDPERGAEKGWASLKSSFDDYLSWVHNSAPKIRNFTGSEMSAAIQRYAALNINKEVYEDKMILKVDNFYDEAYCLIRFNENEFSKVTGGELTKVTGNLYLLRVKDSKVIIDFKR